MADDPQLYRNGYSSADRNLIAADNLVTSIRRMVGQSTAPGQRTLLEHAAMQAADEIERLRAELDIVHRDMAHVTESSTNIIRRLTQQLEEARRG